MLRKLKINAPSWSPNTDGIHIQSSSGITISNSAIMTGDDCISVGPGTKNLWIERIACGPGHGIRWKLQVTTYLKYHIYPSTIYFFYYCYNTKDEKRY